MTPPTNEEMLRECRRELQMRLTFYPRLVAQGKMTQGLMDHQVRLMEAMVAHFEARTVEDAERTRQPELFD